MEIWCNNQDIRFEKRKEYVLYGQLNTDTIVNLVLILGKQYIYWCRNNEQDLSLVQFKMFMWKYARIEYMIAKKIKSLILRDDGNPIVIAKTC